MPYTPGGYLNPALPIAPPFAGHGNGSGVRPPTMPNSGPPSVLSLQIPLPETQPIPDAKFFNIMGSVDTTGVQNGLVVTNSIMNVPDATYGVIRSVTFYINNMITTTQLQFSLVINNVPPQGWANLSIFPRNAPSIGNSYDTLIRFTGAAEIKVLVNDLDGGVYTVGAAFSGWFWPVASDDRWRQYGR